MNDELCFGATLISSGMYFISPVVIAVMVGLLLHKWGKSSLEPLIPAFSIQAGVLGLLIVSSVLGIFELRSNIIYTAKVVEYIILYTGLVVLYIYPGRFLLYSLCVYHLLGVLFLMNALFAAWYSFSSALVPSISIRATAIPLLLLGWQVTRGRG
ncbi:MAG: hypothetical protein K9L17_00745 [Clostridiales bacterium]|nr:hypothetical protein [Clostridiales bacterium]